MRKFMNCAQWPETIWFYSAHNRTRNFRQVRLIYGVENSAPVVFDLLSVTKLGDLENDATKMSLTL